MSDRPLRKTFFEVVLLGILLLGTLLLPARHAAAQENASPIAKLPAPSSQVCVPECRDGFLCHDGLCINACNPPCTADSVCTGSSQPQCRLVREAAPAQLPAQEYPAPSEAWEQEQKEIRDARNARQEEERERRKARRAKRPKSKFKPRTRPPNYRNRPRLLVGARLGLHTTSSRYVLDENISGSQGGLQAGVRWHFNDFWGSQLVAEALFGTWYGERDYSTEGSVSSFRLHLAPYFRPHRHFMIGPTLAFGRNSYFVSRDRFEEATDEGSVWLTGVGLQLGWLLGRSEFVQATTGLMVLQEHGDDPAALPVRGDTVELYSALAVAF